MRKSASARASQALNGLLDVRILHPPNSSCWHCALRAVKASLYGSVCLAAELRSQTTVTEIVDSCFEAKRTSYDAEESDKAAGAREKFTDGLRNKPSSPRYFRSTLSLS